MKTLTALLLLGLLCSLHKTSAQGVMGISAMSAIDCCVKFHTKRIPLGAVISVSRTPSSCPRQALVFTTKKKIRYCVDPSQAWVQSHVTKIESRSMTSSTTIATN
ncbi:C-C motif chemokine 13-like [Salmo salar]|uniref:C-C motif chemokine 13-like n=1 Tax=Salmo salar TaxID=8030 RepID=A0A1S3PWJ4_SALSA|nr:C-C motif chemokine 13-like [Salmo salar]|eukprot:XP_014032068.1 PREDICTED: C-C motif chemokine 13-like [Salmo salar]